MSLLDFWGENNMVRIGLYENHFNNGWDGKFLLVKDILEAIEVDQVKDNKIPVSKCK